MPHIRHIPIHTTVHNTVTFAVLPKTAKILVPSEELLKCKDKQGTKPPCDVDISYGWVSSAS